MMTLFVWYPKCSTCQKAKKKLEEMGVAFELRDIVLDTPTARELKEWIEKGNIELKKLYNVSGNLYKSMDMKNKRLQMSEEEQIALLSENGMLLKRPLLIGDSNVLVGYREAEYEAFAQQK